MMLAFESINESLQRVTNQEFLDSIFGNLRANEHIWLAAFDERPDPKARWGGWAINNTSAAKDFTGRNAYFCVSTIRAIEGKARRIGPHFGRMACVVLDDAKVDPNASWVLQTSEGKYQVGYVLQEDVSDLGVAERLQKALSQQGLVVADSNGYNPVRYVRLPRGSNNKYGNPFAHVLLVWNPENTFMLEDLAHKYGFDLQAVIQPSAALPIEPKGSASDKGNDQPLIEAIVSGEGYHDQINRLAARYRYRGMDEQDVVQTIKGLMSAVAVKDERWKNRFDDIERSVRGAFEKFDPKAEQAQIEPLDPFIEHPVPPFPLGVLPEDLADYAAACSKASGFDEGAYGFALMVIASGVIDQRAKLRAGPMSVPPHLWGALSANSGGGKSPVITATAFAAHEINNRLLRESGKQYADWARLPSDERFAQQPPLIRQLMLDNTTSEAAAKALKDNPEGLLLVLPEMSEWIGRMDAYSGGSGGDKDRGAWIRAFDGGTVSVNRAKDPMPMVLENFSAAMLAGVQPEKLAQMFSKSGAGGSEGLFQRFMPFCMSDPAQVDYGYRLPEFLQANVQNIFERLHGWREAGAFKSFELEAPALALAEAHHNNLRQLAKRTPHGRFAEHIDKLPGLTLRVCLVLHCLSEAAQGKDKPSRQVNRATFEQAQRVLQALYRHAEAAYSTLDKTGIATSIKLARAACEAILSKGWPVFQRGDLTRNATGWDGVDDRQAEAAIDLLIDWGWVADVTPNHIAPRRGRRSMGKFAVNTKVALRFEPHAQRIAKERAERSRAIQQLAAQRVHGQ
jgi:hypothetical protein